MRARPATIEAAATLRDAGFDTGNIGAERLSGADDRVVAARAQSEGRVLITLDRRKRTADRVVEYPVDVSHKHTGGEVHGTGNEGRRRSSYR